MGLFGIKFVFKKQIRLANLYLNLLKSPLKIYYFMFISKCGMKIIVKTEKGTWMTLAQALNQTETSDWSFSPNISLELTPSSSSVPPSSSSPLFLLHPLILPSKIARTWHHLTSIPPFPCYFWSPSASSIIIRSFYTFSFYFVYLYIFRFSISALVCSSSTWLILWPLSCLLLVSNYT